MPKHPAPSCEVATFKSRVQTPLAVPVLPLSLLAGCQRLLHIRIPKTGSGTTNDIIFKAATQNNYTKLFHKGRMPRLIDERMHVSYLKVPSVAL